MKNVKMLILSMIAVISAVSGLSASEESSTRLSAVEQLRSETFGEYRKLFSECDRYTKEEINELRSQYIEKLKTLAKFEGKDQIEQAKDMFEFINSKDLGGLTPLMHVIGHYGRNVSSCEQMLVHGLNDVYDYRDILGEKAEKQK